MTIDVKGQKVKIDREDFTLVSQYNWHISSTGYAVWRGVKDGKKQTIRMHRLITQCPAGLVVDHKNHDQLDNRRHNLQICTQSENMRNRTVQGKGYWYQKQSRKWVVEVWGKHIGSFSSEVEADRIATLIRSGGTYTKPKRTHCRHGHSLQDAYRYGKTVFCKPCLAKRQREYFKRKYVAKPRLEVIFCIRGHDRRLTKTGNGDCMECVKIRNRSRREDK